MRKFTVMAYAVSGLIAAGASANTGAPDPTRTPLSYAAPQFRALAPLGTAGVPQTDLDIAQEYRTERARLMQKYLALEEENNGSLTPSDRAAMRADIAELKARYFGT